ncbi:MAG: DUF1735 domain-containing protein [Sulfuricurvum sp.]|nr:DUF1735 domain-containing protein [Sulfuricurvum sp.]
MKKTLIILILSIGLIACVDNRFEDFNYTAGYFPYQYSVCTFNLNDSTNGNSYKFQIPAIMGGVYRNTNDRVFDIEIATDLCTRALFASTMDTIHLMPSTYYTLGSSDKLTIPAGKLNGSIDLQFTDAFFNDPLACKLHYVIPLRIKSVTSLDSVLRGKSTMDNPDPRVASQWSILPKDYVMIAVKYINKYQGNYFHRGASIIKDPTDKVVENNVYNLNNQIWNLLPFGQNKAYVNSPRNSTLLTGNQKLNLAFSTTGSITITDSIGSVVGTGKFLKNGGNIGSQIRDLIVLSYKYPVQYTAPTPENPIKTVDDIDTKINYVGSWTANSDASFYGGTRHYSNSGSFTYTFTGDGISLYWKTGSTYGAFDVYLDDLSVPVKTDVSTVTPATLYKQKLYEVTGLPFKSHTIKIVVKNAKNTYFDYLVYTIPQIIVPSGSYTFEANDTLVVKDKVFPVETLTPLVY